jgi:hypothetical protein
MRINTSLLILLIASGALQGFSVIGDPSEPLPWNNQTGLEPSPAPEPDMISTSDNTGNGASEPSTDVVYYGNLTDYNQTGGNGTVVPDQNTTQNGSMTNQTRRWRRRHHQRQRPFWTITPPKEFFEWAYIQWVAINYPNQYANNQSNGSSGNWTNQTGNNSDCGWTNSTQCNGESEGDCMLIVWNNCTGETYPNNGSSWDNHTNGSSWDNHTNGSSWDNHTNGSSWDNQTEPQASGNSYRLEGVTVGSQYFSFFFLASNLTNIVGNTTDFGPTYYDSLTHLYNQVVFGLDNATLVAINGTNQQPIQADCDMAFNSAQEAIIGAWDAISANQSPFYTQTVTLDALVRVRRAYLCQTKVLTTDSQAQCLADGFAQYVANIQEIYANLVYTQPYNLANALGLIWTNAGMFSSCVWF